MLEYHVAFLILFVGTAIFFSALALTNLRYGERTLHQERAWVEDQLDLEDLDVVAAYQRAKFYPGQLQTWIVIGLTLILLYSGAFASIVDWLEGLGYHPVITGVLFFVGISVGLQVISIPFDLYQTFVVEERFDFNQQTPFLFFKDFILQLLISVIIVAFLLGAVLWFIEFTPTLWPIAALVLFATFSLVMLVVYPRIIAPIFNDFTPVESGELMESVERVFDRAGFACSQIYVMDASRRSSHSNAYFVGFGRTKRVVLFDTLVEQMQLPEIESVLAHELAHWKENHIWKQFIAGNVRIGIMLGILWYLMQTEWLYTMFGFQETAYIGLFVGMLWIQPIAKLSSPIENKLSLAHEREADTFATEVMGGSEPMIDALSVLTSENLSNPFPHPLYATFHYTHPPIPDRIRYLQQLESDTTTEQPSESA